MKKEDIIAFFDRLAPQWDGDMIKSDKIIETILENAKITAGSEILDVACGTGVMIPYYLNRGVAKVTAIDISPEMVKIAREKFPREDVEILCADVETAVFSQKFSNVMVYNAFPHFPDPARIIEILCKLAKPGGTVTVAHGMSRQEIDARHQGTASKVSIGLMDENRLAELMGQYGEVTCKLSTDKMYQVTVTVKTDN